ncbi:hypothetical protein C6N75_12105 [Streptomyces solincola]|uniref:Uncharacterized protein n=1 Tax=Streptomyces solincola TaxID=2100817 RepID=A0A2S9PX82_9ACTN|nr:hypothetical protein [Streptomyces solincola]PRH78963.1 hypothetical protein C6N75_12105 [Streptomyces solincola]
MNGKALALSGLAVGGGAAVLIRRWKEDASETGGVNDRWHTVTINRPLDEVSVNGRLPEPLAMLGDKIEVQVRLAPGDRGTEVAARLRDPVPSGPAGAGARLRGQDPRGPVRRALRDCRALLETGEVLSPDRPPTTHPGPGGKLISVATGRAREEGRL